VPAPRRSPRRTTRSPASRPRSKATRTTTGADGSATRDPRYLFVGGKGGVGKTTCAAAIALAAALDGSRTLVVSTDPAPSLGDALSRPLGPAPRRVPLRRGRLDAVEIDATAALGRWLDTRRSHLERIALRGTWLDDEDVSRLLRLSLPGIDELAALLEIARFASGGAYDLIVVDTAPTGHTLRMLATPGTLLAVAGVFDQMQAKHRIVVETLRGRWQPDAEDALIEEIDADARRLAALIRDTARTQFTWVTLPEAMAVEETADAAAALAASGMALATVLVNRMTPAPERPCDWCEARQVVEARSIGTLHNRVPGAPVKSITARDAEPRGTRALAGIGTEIEAARPLGKATPRSRRSRSRRVTAAVPGGAAPMLATPDTRLLIFGGKGGVGKTTCAAAAAIALARHSRDRQVLLLSTDPAHSLGDALGAPVSDAAGPIVGGPPNLVAREIDAARGFRNVRERYVTAVDQWFDRLSGGEPTGMRVDAGHDRRVMHGLMELAPPGIDELAGVIEVTDALADPSAGGPDLIVMDTAPSGHALRLLEMPALVQEWVRALMSILLKYQPIAGIGELGAVLLNLSQGLGRLRALLVDPRRTSFVLVTRAAALPREETRRLAGSLAKMNVHVPLILVNAVGRGTCRRCQAATRAEARELTRIERIPMGGTPVPVVVAPSEMPPPHGVTALGRWRSTWRIRPAARRSARP
jgi:arsenite/tail-anchored protein-transporting ATPase